MHLACSVLSFDPACAAVTRIMMIPASDGKHNSLFYRPQAVLAHGWLSVIIVIIISVVFIKGPWVGKWVQQTKSTNQREQLSAAGQEIGDTRTHKAAGVPESCLLPLPPASRLTWIEWQMKAAAVCR